MKTCERIINLYERGKSIYTIADKVGCSPSTVRLRLLESNTPPNPRKNQTREVLLANKQKVLYWLRSGKTITEISLFLRLGRNNVSRELAKLKWRSSEKKPSILDQHRVAIENWRKEGKSYAEIATDLGVGSTCVLNYCHKFHIQPLGKRFFSKLYHLLPEIRRLKRCGHSQKAIAKLLSLSEATICNLLHGHIGGED
ncbi:MAG: helix-turn-helix domain-containing protein [Spirochaetales bacterium]|nr:helix-turn-helix domain-containing protein [Spirochaetales bacterium]